MSLVDPKIEIASGEYDRRVQVVGKTVSIRQVAAVCGVPVNKLVNYRANYISRKTRPKK